MSVDKKTKQRKNENGSTRFIFHRFQAFQAFIWTLWQMINYMLITATCGSIVKFIMECVYFSKKAETEWSPELSRMQMFSTFETNYAALVVWTCLKAKVFIPTHHDTQWPRSKNWWHTFSVSPRRNSWMVYHSLVNRISGRSSRVKIKKKKVSRSNPVSSMLTLLLVQQTPLTHI